MASSKQGQVIYKEGAFTFEKSDNVPVAGPGQALIRVHYSTVNPYDRIVFNNNKDEGSVLGCDGCGVIHQVGEGVDQALVGRKVAFLGSGWSYWTVKDVKYLALFDKEFDLKKGANTYVNPFTVTAMLDFAQKNAAKAVVLTAASSALSKMMIKLCRLHGIETVNIVHRDALVKDLQDNLKCEYVLNQTSPTFFADLEKVIAKVQPTVIFECVGGDLAGDILLRMPHKSIMNIYGNLTKQKVTLHPQEFHWADKHVVGLVMYRWVTSLTSEEREKWFKIVTDDIEHNDGKIFGSHIVKTMPLSKWKEALFESEKDASQGKYLVDCISEDDAKPLKLHYFRGYGRAEAIRLALTYAKVPYENVYYAFGGEDHQKAKTSGNLEFGQFPVLELQDGKFLAQSFSILRYVGITTGLYPGAKEPEASWETDSVIDSLGDIMNAFYRVPFAPNEQAKQESYKQYFTVALPAWLAKIEKRLGDKTYIVNGKVTIADIALCAWANSQGPLNASNSYVKEQEEAIAKHPKLLKYFKDLSALPGIKEHLETRFSSPM